MGKISLVSAKYIVHAYIQIDGVVDKPDVIGAIFGQTEGLLGNDLELRELQRSGRIGRIEVNTETKTGKTAGGIILPSSLDKAETAIVAASLETIERIGPCNSKVKVEKIEDVRVSKRNFVIERAKELLRELTNNVLPDSQEMAEEVMNNVRVMELVEYGVERLPAGPHLEESSDIILVEGRADVLNLLKNDIKNVIGMNGTNIPESLAEITKKKTVTLFVDGDRGGDLIIKAALSLLDLDFITKAPDGKEVEELTKKEIHKSLRSRVAVEQVKLETDKGNGAAHTAEHHEGMQQQREFRRPQRPMMNEAPKENIQRAEAPRGELPRRSIIPPITSKTSDLSLKHKQVFKKMLDDLIGTRGAYILDANLEVLGKVPTIELPVTIKSVKNVYAVVFDGVITRELSMIAEKTSVKYLIAMDSRVRESESKVVCIVNADLL